MTPLLELLADGVFHRGPELAEQLGISRAGINQQIQSIRGQGIVVESVRARGYRMPGGAEWLRDQTIRRALRRTFPGIAVDVLASTDSTNRFLMGFDWASAPRQHAVYAEHQSAGRGRRGRAWVSPWGHNLYMSCAQTFHDGLPDGLSLRVGVSLAKMLAGQGVRGIQVKWPNDLWVADHKCGGILVEVQGDPAGCCRAVIGVGLNVQTPVSVAGQIDQPWTDLRTVGLKPGVTRNQLASRAARAIFQSFEMSQWQDGFAKYDALANRDVRVFGPTSDGDSIGRAVGIDEEGALRVIIGDQERSIRSGEISVRTHA